MLRQGREPLGGVAVAQDRSGEWRYVQAVVLRDGRDGSAGGHRHDFPISVLTLRSQPR